MLPSFSRSRAHHVEVKHIEPHGQADRLIYFPIVKHVPVIKLESLALSMGFYPPSKSLIPQFILVFLVMCFLGEEKDGSNTYSRTP